MLSIQIKEMIHLLYAINEYGDNVILDNNNLWDDYKLLSYAIQGLYDLLPDKFLLLNLN